MEFNEKLQDLRIQKGITQEELAEALFVSRTAVSKWESGRGYPNIDSLKAISAYFKVSIDDLLSGEELLTLAEKDHLQKEGHFRDLLFGLLDCSTLLLLFLPFFGQKSGEILQEVSLLSLNAINPFLRAVYLTAVLTATATGTLTLALQNCRRPLWIKIKNKLSIFLNTAGLILFIAGLQPYAATFSLVFLTIKVLTLIKWQ